MGKGNDFFSRRVKFDSWFNVVAVYEVSFMDQKSFLLHWHPEMSREVVEETFLILQENQRDFLDELVDVVSRWMFSGLDLLQEV